MAPGSAAQRKAYLDELERRLRQIEFTAPAATLYLGGGTPNFLADAELERLLALAARYIPLESAAEISCELNPESLTADKWGLLRAFATRISLGVQSFSAAIRARLGRHCREEHLERALALVKDRLPDQQWNCDLIYGVAGTQWADWEGDLRRVLALNVDHVSCYALTPEENSRLGLTGLATLDDAAQADWWLQTGKLLAAGGIGRYEISNYARPGRECRHNIGVWRGETLLGLGPAAAGFDGCDRYAEPASLDDWLRGDEPEIDRVSPRCREAEIFAVNLRTARGWSRTEWERLRPGSWDGWQCRCLELQRQQPEWWRIGPDQIRLSEAGLLFWDSVAMALLP